MSNRICILTGAGISQESGVPVYRGSQGLWRGKPWQYYASPEAWQEDPDSVSDFYDQRRCDLAKVQPNAAHQALVTLQEAMDVTLITQNVDDLHERAGSRQVYHMHGLLTEVRSEFDPAITQHIGYQPAPHQRAADGGRWRPAVVWFGEDVLHLDAILAALHRCSELWIIGTSLEVFPASEFLHFCPAARRLVYVDPAPAYVGDPRLRVITEAAGTAVPRLVRETIER